MKMTDPITKSKSTVSPYIKRHTAPTITIEPPTDTDFSPLASRTVIPIIKAVNGNIVLAPQPSVLSEDIAALANAIDKRVDALINYLEKWIQVGNLKMTNIKEYIQNYHD